MSQPETWVVQPLGHCEAGLLVGAGFVVGREVGGFLVATIRGEGLLVGVAIVDVGGIDGCAPQ